jgi:multidrug efflux pump
MDLQRKWSQIAGALVAAFPLPSLPGSQGLPVQFVITTTEPVENLNEVAQAVIAEARKEQLFWFADLDLKLDKPQAKVVVDRSKVAALGMTDADVGSALSAALGGNYVNYFSIAGRSYKVIPQVLAGRPTQSGPGSELLHPNAHWCDDPGQHGGARRNLRRA